jgi:hypothetical protein
MLISTFLSSVGLVFCSVLVAWRVSSGGRLGTYACNRVSNDSDDAGCEGHTS